MKHGKNGPLLAVHGVMEFIWRYAWAGFVTAATVHRPFPLLEALTVFTLAAGLTLLSRGKGWRIVYAVGLQAIGLVFAAGILVHAFYFRDLPFWSLRWVSEFFAAQRVPVEWMVLVLLFFWLLVFWAGGVGLVRRAPGYTMICNRFDLGLGAFFVLFLSEWLFLAKGGIQAVDPLARLLIFPYFFLSLFAMGLARNRGGEQRQYLPGYHGIGLISTVLATLAVIGAGLFLLFLPGFTTLAEMGYAVMKEAAEPLGPVLIRILRFLLLGPRFRPPDRQGAGGGPDPDLTAGSPGSWWGDLLQEFVKWGFTGLLAATLVMLAAFWLWVLGRWLFSRTPVGEKTEGPRSIILLWLERIRAFLVSLRAAFLHRGKTNRGAARLYATLLAWGRRSGLPHARNETPYEYGIRLKGRFPPLEREIETIIESFHREIYGEIGLQAHELLSARSASRRLRSPRMWPSRLRGWFLRP